MFVGTLRPFTMMIPRALPALAGLWLATLQPSAAQTPPTDTPRDNGAKLEAVIDAIKADNWQEATLVAATIPDDAAQIYLNWRSLRAGLGSWEAYAAFVRRHGDWPGLPLLQRAGEPKIPTGRPPQEIVAFFSVTKPQTGRGALRLAEALKALGRTEAAEAEIKRAWANVPMMLWRGERNAVRNMLSLLPPGQRRLAEARLALRAGQNRVNDMIDAVPATLKGDPGLAFERFRWRMRRDRGLGRATEAAGALLHA